MESTYFSLIPFELLEIVCDYLRIDDIINLCNIDCLYDSVFIYRKQLFDILKRRTDKEYINNLLKCLISDCIELTIYLEPVDWNRLLQITDLKGDCRICHTVWLYHDSESLKITTLCRHDIRGDYADETISYNKTDKELRRVLYNLLDKVNINIKGWYVII